MPFLNRNVQDTCMTPSSPDIVHDAPPSNIFEPLLWKVWHSNHSPAKRKNDSKNLQPKHVWNMLCQEATLVASTMACSSSPISKSALALRKLASDHQLCTENSGKGISCKKASVAHGLCLVPLKSPHGFIWKVWIHCEFMRALTPSWNAQSLSSPTLKFEGFWRRAASVSLAPSPLEAQPAESSHGSTFKCLIPMSLHHVTPLVVDHGVYQGQDPSRLQCNLGSFTTKVHAAWEPNWSASSSLAWIWLVSSRLRLECKTPNLRSKGKL